MTSSVIRSILIVGTGSFLGGTARYIISLVMNNMGKGVPWATLAANLIGSLLIGILWGLFSRSSNDGGSWALFMTVGFCGGFTTFSTFSKEALMMLQSGNFWCFAGYVAISVTAGIAMVALGYWGIGSSGKCTGTYRFTNYAQIHHSRIRWFFCSRPGQR